MIRQISFPALCLFILLLSSPGAHKSFSMAFNLPFTSQPESPDGVQLFYDEHGLYVQADLADPTYFTFSNATLPVKMMIDLSHSETLLPVNCLSFINHSCQKYSCQNNGTVLLDVNFPFFATKSIETQAFVSIHSKFWNLTKSAYLTSSCTPGTSTDKSLFGMDRSGIIGLGNVDHAARNFLSSKVFSIYLEQDIVRGGKIYFKNNNDLASSKDSSVTLRANSNWQVADQNGLIQIGTNWYTQTPYKLYFDLNSDVIGLSDTIYDSLLYAFGVYNPTYYPYRPTLTSTYAKVTDWPNLILYLQNQRVEIPATVYATALGDKKYMLNFRRLSIKSVGENYVNERFTNAVVLNYNFLKYCYTVFDGSAGYNQIKLYFNTNGKNRDVNMNDDSVPDKPGTYKKEMVTAYSFFITLIYLIIRKCWKKEKGYSAL